MREPLQAIDPMFIDAIVAARRDGKLEIVEEDDEVGATLKFPFMSSQITMHLGGPNWATVRAALTAAADA